MGIPNEELIQKAVITTDAIAAYGKLSPAQADKFIDYIVDETVLRNNCRFVRFRNEQLDIDKIGVAGRVMVPKAEAADPGVRFGVQTSQVTLQPKNVMCPFEIGDEFLRTAIESPEQLEDHIVKMMARRFSNNLEEFAINGDTVGPAAIQGDIRPGGSTTQYVKDALLALSDGWLRGADGANIYDAEGANIGLSVFGGMIRQMPTKFRRDKSQLRFITSPDLEQVYIEKLSTRATPLGDRSAEGATHTPYGIPLVGVPLLSFLPRVVQHITLAASATVALRFGPVSSVVVCTETLGATPEDAFVEDTDYSVDYTNGTITNLDVGIGDGDVVKVTYDANPQSVLTNFNNLICGVGLDVKIEKDRDIYKSTTQYAISAKVAVTFEELEAVVKGQNIGQGV